jgi:3-oxoacyl-[acyl-carrier protein] reductase
MEKIALVAAPSIVGRRSPAGNDLVKPLRSPRMRTTTDDRACARKTYLAARPRAVILNQSTDRLDDRRAVVTGSTSGIGRAIALELAAAGADMVIHGRDATRAEDVCAAIQGMNRKATPVIADLADAAKLESFVDRLWREAPIEVWINNAGVDVLTGDAANWPFGVKLARLWEIDVRATIELSRAVGRRMRERGRGVILNIGWDQSELGMAGDSGEMFAAVKGAVASFTRSLAKSLAPQVRVNCIAPGWIRTAWGESASDQWQERARQESLLGRWGTPEDIARTARFLASPASSFINGQVVAVNGGRADAADRDAEFRST